MSNVKLAIEAAWLLTKKGGNAKFFSSIENKYNINLTFRANLANTDFTYLVQSQLYSTTVFIGAGNQAIASFGNIVRLQLAASAADHKKIEVNQLPLYQITNLAVKIQPRNSGFKARGGKKGPKFKRRGQGNGGAQGRRNPRRNQPGGGNQPQNPGN